MISQWWRLSLPILIMVGASGCNISMIESPFSFDETRRTLELLGSWIDKADLEGPNKASTWTVLAPESENSNALRVVWRNAGEVDKQYPPERRFRARLVDFLGNTFLEMFSTTMIVDDVPVDLPVHVLFRISLDGDEVTLWQIEPRKLYDKVSAPRSPLHFTMIRNWGGSYPYEQKPHCCVLTGDRSELRTLLEQGLKEEGLFRKVGTYVRILGTLPILA